MQVLKLKFIFCIMQYNRLLFVFMLCIAFLFCLMPLASYGQGERQVVSFTGLIVEGDSAYGIPGVHVYVPRAGRGAVTNSLGYFTLTSLEGDTVQISAVGYKTETIVIPRRGESRYSVLIDMQEDIMTLSEIEVFPFANEREFKEAFLALEFPESDIARVRKELSKERLSEMSATMPMSAGANYRYHMNQRDLAQANRYFNPALPLTNPFAWSRFIKSLRDGDLKKKLRTTEGSAGQ
ncbi:MAG: carboxypeptidase-like regulatory domain-containing protein [Bernardetiaceae bacterium]|nr:carboxypeptidase-like regulatory domain-containing protein [Bernardetiaceae bacterium]